MIKKDEKKIEELQKNDLDNVFVEEEYISIKSIFSWN